MAAEEFGWSINGRRIEIISADHQNKPDIGAGIARQWFDVEHVDVIADLTNSAVGFAVVEVAKPRNKIVLVSGPGSSDFTGKACAPTSIQWTWDTYAAATGTARAMVGPDANTWFFIASDFAFGHALERDAASAVEKLGGKVVGQVWPPFNNSDFSSYLLQAQQSKASVIAFATSGQDTVNLVKQAAEFNLAKPGTRVVPMQMMLDEVKAIGTQLGQGDYATVAFHHDRSPEARNWAQRFFERMKAMPTQIQAGTYSAVRHYLQAVKDRRHRRAAGCLGENADNAGERHVCHRRLYPRGRSNGARHVSRTNQDPGRIERSVGPCENHQDHSGRRGFSAAVAKRMPACEKEELSGAQSTESSQCRH